MSWPAARLPPSAPADGPTGDRPVAPRLRGGVTTAPPPSLLLGWLRRLDRVRREALGMNRRNLAFLVPFNDRQLFALVDYKPMAKTVLAAAGIPVPPTYGALRMLWDVRRLSAALAGHTAFVVKPARGSAGGGVLVIAGRCPGGFLKASGAMVPSADLASHCADILAGAFSPRQHADEVMIEYRVQADPVLGAVSYRGVPDVRVLVFRGVPIQAMIRLPTRASDGRANLHRGGMAVGIDLAAGVTTFGTLRRRPADRHPDLDVPVGGLQVPHWGRVLEIAARCADAVPLGYLGVDVVLDAERGPVVLELNARPGLTIQVANRRGLRRVMDHLACAPLEGLSPAERIALGRRTVAACDRPANGRLA